MNIKKLTITIDLLVPLLLISLSGIFNQTTTQTFALTKEAQHYQIGYIKGCQDGQNGKSPDQTQYDKVGGFSIHTIDYNNGYIDGFNTCSTTNQIDPFVD